MKPILFTILLFPFLCLGQATVVDGRFYGAATFAPVAGGGGGTVERIGSPVQYDLGTAASGNQSISVPADCTLVIVGFSGYNSSANAFSGGSVTINSAALTAVAADSSTSTYTGCGFYKFSPSTGRWLRGIDHGIRDVVIRSSRIPRISGLALGHHLIRRVHQAPASPTFRRAIATRTEWTRQRVKIRPQAQAALAASNPVAPPH